MQYKKNLESTLNRLKDFYQGNAMDRILAKMNVPSKIIQQYAVEHPETYCEYPDIIERERFWDTYLNERSKILDDSIPAAYLSEFDEGIYSAIVGGNIRFMNDSMTGWVSSMGVPSVKTAEELLSLKLDINGKWAQIYVKQLQYFAEKSRGKYGISHFILIDGLNFLLELRGATNAIYDTIDAPEIVRKVFDLAREVNFWVQDTYFDICGLYNGGTISNMCQWVPGRVVSESLDPFHLMSLDDFEQWGVENIERVFAHYDGGVFHIHSNGHHLLERACQIRGVKSVSLLDEAHNPIKNYMILDELDRLRGTIPIHLDIPYEAMEKGLKEHTLPGNVYFNVLGVPDINAANDMMEIIKNYRV